MIFVKDTVYAKVWDVKKFDKYVDLRISTSEKNKDGDYVYSNWFARAIGHAKNSLEDCARGDNIVISTCKISNVQYEKDGEKRNRLEFIILEAEKRGGNSSGNEKPTPEEKPQPATKAVDVEADENCPW